VHSRHAAAVNQASPSTPERSASSLRRGAPQRHRRDPTPVRQKAAVGSAIACPQQLGHEPLPGFVKTNPAIGVRQRGRPAGPPPYRFLRRGSGSEQQASMRQAAPSQRSRARHPFACARRHRVQRSGALENDASAVHRGPWTHTSVVGEEQVSAAPASSALQHSRSALQSRSWQATAAPRDRRSRMGARPIQTNSNRSTAVRGLACLDR
jgi:hypothetical protein